MCVFYLSSLKNKLQSSNIWSCAVFFVWHKTTPCCWNVVYLVVVCSVFQHDISNVLPPIQLHPVSQTCSTVWTSESSDHRKHSLRTCPLYLSSINVFCYNLYFVTCSHKRMDCILDFKIFHKTIFHWDK